MLGPSRWSEHMPVVMIACQALGLIKLMESLGAHAHGIKLTGKLFDYSHTEVGSLGDMETHQATLAHYLDFEMQVLITSDQACTVNLKVIDPNNSAKFDSKS